MKRNATRSYRQLSPLWSSIPQYIILFVTLLRLRLPVDTALGVDKRLDLFEILLLTACRESPYVQNESDVQFGGLNEVDSGNTRHAVAFGLDVLHHYESHSSSDNGQIQPLSKRANWPHTEFTRDIVTSSKIRMKFSPSGRPITCFRITTANRIPRTLTVSAHTTNRSDFFGIHY